MNTWTAVSLFSNCGAGDLGFGEAGFRFRVMAELDPRRLEVALLNHPQAVGIPGDLRLTWKYVVAVYRKHIGSEPPSLLAACPPCQGMSTARSGRGRQHDADAGSKDDRNLLVTTIAEVANALKPRIIVVENVPAFLTRQVRHPSTGLPVSAASLLIEMLQNHYVAFPFIADLCDYGVPQTRERAFLTFIDKDVVGLNYLSKEGLSPYPFPTHVPEYGGKQEITLSEALLSFCLPSLDAKCRESASLQQDSIHELHFVPVWSDSRYKMVAAIPPNTGASAWQNTQCENCGPVEVEEDDAVCPKCHGPLLRPVIKEIDGTYRLIKGYRATSYRRMHPDRPAATVTTGSGHLGSSYNIHPHENRLLSPLECALLQTIPSNFDWGNALAKWGHTNIREMIGEAVPPLFTKRHGEVLVDLLGNDFSHRLLPKDDIRCLRALKSMERHQFRAIESSSPTGAA